MHYGADWTMGSMGSPKKQNNMDIGWRIAVFARGQGNTAALEEACM